MLKSALELLSKCVTEPRLTSYARVASLRTNRVHLAFENICDAYNLSACLRTSEVFGVQNVHVIEPLKFRPVKLISKSTQEWLSVQQYKTTDTAMDCFRQQDLSIWSSDLVEGALRLDDDQTGVKLRQLATMGKRFAFVFGNEKNGITATMRSASDIRFVLPMQGFTKSFNVNVATAITLTYLKNYGILEPSLTEEEKDKLVLSWMMKEIGFDGARLLLIEKGIPVDAMRLPRLGNTSDELFS